MALNKHLKMLSAGSSSPEKKLKNAYISQITVGARRRQCEDVVGDRRRRDGVQKYTWVGLGLRH